MLRATSTTRHRVPHRDNTVDRCDMDTVFTKAPSTTVA
jgi:hypothetical protein